MIIRKYNWKQLNESFFDDLEDDLYNDNLENLTELYDYITVVSKSNTINIVLDDKRRKYKVKINEPSNIVIDLPSNIISLYNAFADNNDLISIDFSGIGDIHNLTNMERMFYDCHSLNSIKFNNFNTSNVTTMHKLFYRCFALKTIDLENINFDKNYIQHSTKLRSAEIY